MNKRRYPMDALERILCRTTLSTQRVLHSHILGIGDELTQRDNDEVTDDKSSEIEEAVHAAEVRFTKEMHFALKRLETRLLKEKDTAIQKQKEHYESLAKRVAAQRDQLESKRMEEHKKECERQNQAALDALREECEHAKEQAAKEAVERMVEQVREEEAEKRREAVAEALTQAQENFKLQEAAAKEETRKKCEEDFMRRSNRAEELHRRQMETQQIKYKDLQTKYEELFKHNHQVETDFSGLQDDYMRFMDYTDGKFHSDYMMYLRQHGLHIARKPVTAYSETVQLPKIN